MPARFGSPNRAAVTDGAAPRRAPRLRGALTPTEGRYFDVLRPRVEDDFRGGPHIKVRLTVARPSRYLPQLRRLAGVRVRVARVRYSERVLRRLQNRVGVLFDRPPAGVTVGSSSVDIDANRTVIEVATRRTDVQEEVRRRFGPAVRVDVVAADPIRIVCRALDHVQVGADGREIALHWSDSGSVELERAVVEEGPDVVRLGVLTRVPAVGGITADLQGKVTPVRLAAPLGSRRVVDAETGRPLEVRRP